MADRDCAPDSPYQCRTWKDLPPMNASVGSMRHNLTGSWRFIRPIYENKTPPCQATCPAGNDIEGWIRLLMKGREEEAWQVLRLEQPFPALLGRVCPAFCQESCNRKVLDGRIAIRELERYLGDRIPPAAPMADQRPSNGHSIAVVGSGPAGMAAAFFGTMLGFSVTVFEARPELGGMLRYGIPAYRLPRSVLDLEFQGLNALGVRFQTGVRVKDPAFLDALLQDHDFLFLATGAGKSFRLGLEGEETTPRVMSGLFLLSRIASGHSMDLGERVIVVGGGNTALDAARSARRLGADVSVVYRRALEDMPALAEEIEEAKREGIEFVSPAAPTGIELAADGRILSVAMVEMALGSKDDSGRKRPFPKENNSFHMEADTLVTAIGQGPDFEALVSETRWNDGSVPVKDSQEVLGGPDKVFAGGDLVPGPRTVVRAVAAGKRAVLAMDCQRLGLEWSGTLARITIGPGPGLSLSEYLGLAHPRGIPRRLDKVVGPEGIVLDYFEKAAPVAIEVRQPAQRLASFEPFRATFTSAQALAEGARCLHCGRCTECDNCLVFCPDSSVRVGEDPAGAPYRIDYDYCKGCGICWAECPRQAITMVEEESARKEEG